MYPHSGYFNIKTHKTRQYFPTAKNKPKKKGQKMNEKIIKPGVVKRITDQIKDKNPLCTPEAVDDVLTAFFNVITSAMSEGDSVILKGYMTIKPLHRPQYRANTIASGDTKFKTIVIPEHYVAKIKAGTKLKEAAQQLTEKQIGVRE